MVLGFLHKRPESMPVVDNARHATMVRELLDHRLGADLQGRLVPAATLPLSRLRSVLANWVRSFGQHQARATLTSFALDTADLIRVLTYGRVGYERDEVRISGLIEADDGDDELRFLDDSQFRKSLTERFISRAITVCRVPEDSYLPHIDGSRILTSGNDFTFVLERCHLSQTPAYEYPGINFEVPDAEVQWTHFEFDGYILLTELPEGLLKPWLPPEPMLPQRWGFGWGHSSGVDIRTRVPGAWITHELLVEDMSLSTARAIPVPTWLP